MCLEVYCLLVFLTSHMLESSSRSVTRCCRLKSKHRPLLLPPCWYRVIPHWNDVANPQWLSSGEDVVSLSCQDESDEECDNTITVKTVKQLLTGHIQQPRFRQRLLDSSGIILADDVEVTPPDTLYLVLMSLNPSSPKEQALWFEAAKNADLPELETYLSAPHDPNIVAERGETALHIAATLGSVDCCSLLLEARSDVNHFSLPAFDGASVTALHMASVRGHLKVVELLLQAKSEVNKTTNDGDTALHFATFKGHAEVVRLLLASGADKDILTTDDSSFTPLLIACKLAHIDVVECLLEAGADKDKASSTTGITPLLTASQKNHLEVVNLLLAAGADTEKVCTYTGCTALYMATQNDSIEVVRSLIHARADLDKGSGEASEVTPLLAAAQKGYVEITRLLLEAGATVDKASTDESVTTPLLAASHQGNLEIVQLLVEHGADYQRARSSDGATPLSVAYEEGQMQVALFLQGLCCRKRRRCEGKV